MEHTENLRILIMKRSSSKQLTMKCLRLALAASATLMAFSSISYAQMPPAQGAYPQGANSQGASPQGSSPQGSSPITRAQVRAELEELEAVGYVPWASDPHYPDDILAAEGKVAQKHLAERNAAAPAAESVQRPAPN
jgi:hypothetical protein